jgi:hypothetical protein
LIVYPSSTTPTTVPGASALFHRRRFVQRRIETLAQRLDRAHAETLERQREQAPGGFDAFDQRSLLAARLLADAENGPGNRLYGVSENAFA